MYPQCNFNQREDTKCFQEQCCCNAYQHLQYSFGNGKVGIREDSILFIIQSNTLFNNHFNITIHSRRHEEALEHAKIALKKISQKGQNQGSENLVPDDNYENKGTLNIIAVAYHNLAVEYEFLKDYLSACENYWLALEIARHDLGENHPTTIMVLNRYNHARTVCNEERQVRK